MELCGPKEPPRVPKRPELPNRPEPWRTPNRSEAFRTVPNRPDEPSLSRTVPNRLGMVRGMFNGSGRFVMVRDGDGLAHTVRFGTARERQPSQPSQPMLGCRSPVEENPKQSRACSLALAVLRKLARTEKCGSLQHSPSTVDNTRHQCGHQLNPSFVGPSWES